MSILGLEDQDGRGADTTQEGLSANGEFRTAAGGFPRKGAQVKRKGDGLTGEVYAVRPAKGLLAIRRSGQSGQETLVISLEEFTRDWELTGNWILNPHWLRESSAYLLAIAVIAIGFFVGIKACSGGFTLPPDVIDHRMSVVDGTSELDVTLEIPEPGGTSPGEVSEAGYDILQIVKHEGQANGTETAIVFHLIENTGGGYDQYGRERPRQIADAFDIRYSMDDVRKINWDTVGSNPRWLLDLGSVSNVTGVGAEAIKKFCEDEGFGRWAQVFCADY